jgi:hypothetical protein
VYKAAHLRLPTQRNLDQRSMPVDRLVRLLRLVFFHSRAPRRAFAQPHRRNYRGRRDQAWLALPTPDVRAGIRAAGGLSLDNMNLKPLIMAACRVREYQLPGESNWPSADRVHLDAGAEKKSEDTQLLLMLRTLLAERLQLAFHREKKIGPGTRWSWPRTA